MIELLVVVGLIVLMAAIAVPNIAGYVRNAKVRGATQQVAGEIQAARNKAITKNVNPGTWGGVAFVVVDANSYRFTVYDDNFAGQPSVPPDLSGKRGLAPLRDLPQGLSFVPAAVGPARGFGFDQLGRRCTLVTDEVCAQQAALDSICADGLTRCTDRPPAGPAATYVETLAAPATAMQIRVRDESNGTVRSIQIEAGGRVLAQR